MNIINSKKWNSTEFCCLQAQIAKLRPKQRRIMHVVTTSMPLCFVSNTVKVVVRLDLLKRNAWTGLSERQIAQTFKVETPQYD